MTVFERATRQKIRFSSETAGKVNVEDLWDLPLEALDALAQRLAKKVQGAEPVSFIKAPATSDEYKTNKLRFEVVKRVIEVRLADKGRAEKAAAGRAETQRILEAIDKKKGEDLGSLSVEELQAKLDGQAEVE